MTVKVQLWYTNFYDPEDTTKLYIPSKQVKEATYLYNAYIIDGIFPKKNDIDILNDLLDILAPIRKFSDIDEVKELLKFVFPGAAVDVSDMSEQYITKEHTLIYDVYGESSTFGYLDSDYEFCPVFEYWDGHNFKTMAADGDMGTEEYEISEDSLNLDEYDGRNVVTGGMGHHATLHKEIGTGNFIVHLMSDYEGELDEGLYLTESELADYLKSIDRDVESYLKQAQAIEEN